MILENGKLHYFLIIKLIKFIKLKYKYSVKIQFPFNSKFVGILENDIKYIIK